MSFYTVLVAAYNRFVSIFPPSLQWLVTLLVLIGFIVVMIGLVRRHILFLLVVILLLPFFVPVLMSLIGDMYHFVLFLLAAIGLKFHSS